MARQAQQQQWRRRWQGRWRRPLLSSVSLRATPQRRALAARATTTTAATTSPPLSIRSMKRRRRSDLSLFHHKNHQQQQEQQQEGEQHVPVGITAASACRSVSSTRSLRYSTSLARRARAVKPDSGHLSPRGRNTAAGPCRSDGTQSAAAATAAVDSEAEPHQTDGCSRRLRARRGDVFFSYDLLLESEQSDEEDETEEECVSTVSHRSLPASSHTHTVTTAVAQTSSASAVTATAAASSSPHRLSASVGNSWPPEVSAEQKEVATVPSDMVASLNSTPAPSIPLDNTVECSRPHNSSAALGVQSNINSDTAAPSGSDTTCAVSADAAAAAAAAAADGDGADGGGDGAVAADNGGGGGAVGTAVKRSLKRPRFPRQAGSGFLRRLRDSAQQHMRQLVRSRPPAAAVARGHQVPVTGSGDGGSSGGSSSSCASLVTCNRRQVVSTEAVPAVTSPSLTTVSASGHSTVSIVHNSHQHQQHFQQQQHHYQQQQQQLQYVSPSPLTGWTTSSASYAAAAPLLIASVIGQPAGVADLQLRRQQLQQQRRRCVTSLRQLLPRTATAPAAATGAAQCASAAAAAAAVAVRAVSDTTLLNNTPAVARSASAPRAVTTLLAAAPPPPPPPLPSTHLASALHTPAVSQLNYHISPPLLASAVCGVPLPPAPPIGRLTHCCLQLGTTAATAVHQMAPPPQQLLFNCVPAGVAQQVSALSTACNNTDSSTIWWSHAQQHQQQSALMISTSETGMAPHSSSSFPLSYGLPSSTLRSPATALMTAAAANHSAVSALSSSVTSCAGVHDSRSAASKTTAAAAAVAAATEVATAATSAITAVVTKTTSCAQIATASVERVLTAAVTAVATYSGQMAGVMSSVLPGHPVPLPPLSGQCSLTTSAAAAATPAAAAVAVAGQCVGPLSTSGDGRLSHTSACVRPFPASPAAASPSAAAATNRSVSVSPPGPRGSRVRPFLTSRSGWRRKSAGDKPLVPATITATAATATTTAATTSSESFTPLTVPSTDTDTGSLIARAAAATAPAAPAAAADTCTASVSAVVDTRPTPATGDYSGEVSSNTSSRVSLKKSSRQRAKCDNSVAAGTSRHCLANGATAEPRQSDESGGAGRKRAKVTAGRAAKQPPAATGSSNDIATPSPAPTQQQQHHPAADTSAAEDQLPEVPVFRPSAQQFADPLLFLQSVWQQVQQYGMCRIVPPSCFQPECRVDDNMRFVAYNHYVQKVFRRWGPNFGQLLAIRHHLHQQGIELDDMPQVGGVEVDLPDLYRTVTQQPGGLNGVIAADSWPTVARQLQLLPKNSCSSSQRPAAAAKLDRLYCRLLLSYTALSDDERRRLADRVRAEWSRRQRARETRYTQRAGAATTTSSSSSSRRGHHLAADSDSDHSDATDCSADSDSDSDDAAECIVKGKSTTLASFYRVASNVSAVWYGAQSPDTSTVERDYWRLVTERDRHVCVYSGSVSCHSDSNNNNNSSSSSCCGFVCDSRSSGSSGRHSSWNLKLLAANQLSVLRAAGQVAGVTVPTLHMAMLYTTGCWYSDPHQLPWIEYLHTGSDKIWYSVAASQQHQLRHVVQQLVPGYLRPGPVWLPSDTVMVPPAVLASRGVCVYRCVQRAGEFVVAASGAFNASVCTGYTLSESVFFAPLHWLHSAPSIFRQLRRSREPGMFSLHKLLLSLALDAACHSHSHSSAATLSVVRDLLSRLCQQEVRRISRIKSLGVKCQLPLSRHRLHSCSPAAPSSHTQSILQLHWRPQWPPSAGQSGQGEESECAICNASLYTSMLELESDGTFYCLQHGLGLLQKHKLTADTLRLHVMFSQSEYDAILLSLKTKISDLQTQELPAA